MITTSKLDELAKKYETKDFIKDDPIQFPHRYTDKRDIEIAGLIASMLAYGKRELFIAKLNLIFGAIKNKPFEYVINCKDNLDVLNNIDYRFAKTVDIKQVFLILNKLYSEGNTLENLFRHGWNNTQDVKNMLQAVVDYFYSNVTLEVTSGFYHLLPNPKNNSPLKRLNMFLRWMVRDGEVDLGVWKFMPKSELLIPLDVHVSKISRSLNLITRSSNDYKTVLELTNALKEYDSNDPVRLDFAIFGYGVNN